MAEPQTFGAAIQDILTRGLDAGIAIVQSRLQVNDPTPSITGANGQRVPVGQSAAVTGASGLAAVPTWAWVVGGVVVGLAVLVPLLRR